MVSPCALYTSTGTFFFNIIILKQRLPDYYLLSVIIYNWLIVTEIIKTFLFNFRIASLIQLLEIYAVNSIV